MGRVAKLTLDQLNDRQRKLAAEIGATRGGGPALGGPWGLLLRNEELCERAARFGTLLRDGTSVPKRLSELAILVSARLWTAQYEWMAHAPQALKAGVSQGVIDAIRERRRPSFEHSDESAAYEFITELYENKGVSDAAYRSLVGHIGEQAAIELTAVAGFYSTVAMLIVAFQPDLPEGATPSLPE
jgi:4-carboxymuconolactone decarboxylase